MQPDRRADSPDGDARGVPRPRPRSLVGLGTSTVYPETTASAFELAAELGYDGVELMVGIDPPSTDIDYVHKLQDYHQVAVLSVHSPCLVITQNVWSPDPWQRLRMSCHAAVTLGADLVVVHPPFRWQREYARTFVAGVRELAAETGVTIAVENMYPWRGPGASLQAYLPGWDPTDQDFDDLTLDLSHAATARVRALDYVDAWGPRLRHVHLTDGLGSVKDEHLFPGQGAQDAWEVVRTLAAHGFTGHVIHEINTRRLTRDERELQLGECLAETRHQLAAGRLEAAKAGRRR
ncbi:sugar phosphate isomerase/epimerase [Brooklawnia cerclae]|uniref:Sugar phosphate isomerase/epimerase n=1 Tax=Brooklawnia cerclae TaxID=349934 RepID=A0ABX0SB17_9ACTN|nr:sugar phosphate isomerase/epimerase [Brooklawnia cerclae]